MTFSDERWDGIDAIAALAQRRIEAGNTSGLGDLLRELRGEVAAARFEARAGACQCGIATTDTQAEVAVYEAKAQAFGVAPRAEPADPRLYGFTGSFCPDCGGTHMVRSGTCEKCADCGATTGCS